MTLLQRYLLREVLWSWLIATPVVVVVLMSFEMNRLILRVLSGEIHSDYLWTLFWLRIPTDIGHVIPLTLFVSILLTFGRLYQDSEVTAISSAGVDLYRASRGVRRLGGGIALLVAILTLIVAPWGQREINRLNDKIITETHVGGLTPGRFKEIGRDSGRVFYAEEVTPNGRELVGVMLYEEPSPGHYRMITAERGTLVPAPNAGGRWLELRDGRQYQGRPGEQAMEIIDFRRRQREGIPSRRRKRRLSCGDGSRSRSLPYC